MNKFWALLSGLTFCSVSLVSGQDAEPGNVPVPAAKPARTGYMAMKLDEFPRDAQGFLTAAVWDIIQTEAAANPKGNDASAIKNRPIFQAYYATYKGWTPPAPPPVAPGKLRNLADIPKQPRFPLTDKVWPARPGEASVCLWEDDKLAAMSLGVDDNMAMDLPYWKELSTKYGGLKITWNLITCNIDGAIMKGRISSTGTWQIWQRMLGEGNRLASHSSTHNNCPVPADGWPGPEWEAAESLKQLDTHLTGQKTKLFVWPGSGVHAFGIVNSTGADSPWRAAIVKYYAAARGGGGQPISEANMIDYFNIHSTTAVQNIIDNPDPKMARYSLENLFASDPSNPYHKYYRGWANVFIHFINNGENFDTNPYTIAYGKVLAFYNEHRADLWTGFVEDIALYGQERDTATLTTDESTASRITLTLNSKMDPIIFNYPLTIKVRLPDSWKSVKASQDAKAAPAEFLKHENAPYALVKALPDRGQIVLTP